MDILAFTDMHGSDLAFHEIKNKAKKADILVCGGDISIFENNLDELLAGLDNLNKTILIIPGNHEDSKDLDVLTKELKNVINIHKKSFIMGDCLFLGYGGAGFSAVDPEFNDVGRKFESHISKFKGNKVILVTHAPPYHTRIDNIMGEACGNKNIKAFILKSKPDLVISGHLHENATKEDRIGKTSLINPGPFGKIVRL